MNDESSKKPPEIEEPVGAAALVDKSLLSRAAPGQAPPQPGAPEQPKKAAEPKGKGPVDDQGNPRQLTLAEAKTLKEAVIEAAKSIFDPEIPVNIYELGLVYNISVALDGTVDVKMTLTSPACPVAGSLPGEVEQKFKAIDQVKDACVTLVWDPPWDKSMMSEAAKLELNLL